MTKAMDHFDLTMRERLKLFDAEESTQVPDDRRRARLYVELAAYLLGRDCAVYRDPPLVGDESFYRG